MKRGVLTVYLSAVAAALGVASGGLARLGHRATAAESGWQPDRGALVSAPTMSAARAAHTATALPDGRILVAGGFVEKGSAKGAEVYEPNADRFAPIPDRKSVV